MLAHCALGPYNESPRSAWTVSEANYTVSSYKDEFAVYPLLTGCLRGVIPDRREPYRRVPLGRVHLDERRLDEVQ